MATAVNTTTHVHTISLPEIKQLLDSKAPVQFWNVLTDEYFKNQLIPGSRRVALDKVGDEVRTTGLAKDSRIVVYCAGPRCPQSTMAAEKLTKLGYTDVQAFEGGIEEWSAAGYPIQTL